LELLKPRIDVGLVTSDVGPALRFWGDQVQLPLKRTHVFREDFTQYRYDALGSWVKVNHLAAPSRFPASVGYQELLIARTGPPRALVGPQGTRVSLVQPGTCDVWQVGLRIVATNLDLHLAFFRNAFGFPERMSMAGAVLRAGESVLLLEERADEPAPARQVEGGWRFLSFEVEDVDAAYNRAIAAGGRELVPPTTSGSIRGGLIGDPDDNVVELMRGG
jgi:predicted enzyme related to lactoylglutathione lyase